MNAFTILAAFLVVGCGALEQVQPSLDAAMTHAMRVGGCVQFKCDFPPVENCRIRPGSCR